MMNQRSAVVASMLGLLFVFAGCQAAQPTGSETRQTSPTENNEIQPPSTITLPGDEEKSLPAEAPSNMPKEDSVSNEEGDLGLTSSADQQQLEEAYGNQDSSLCQQIKAESLKSTCLENLQESSQSDGEKPEGESSYQEYGDTEEPEVNPEESKA